MRTDRHTCHPRGVFVIYLVDMIHPVLNNVFMRMLKMCMRNCIHWVCKGSYAVTVTSVKIGAKLD